MIPIVKNETANAANDGHRRPRSCHREWPPALGTLISRTSSVIAMAKTPSLNASTRLLVTRRSLTGRADSGLACAVDGRFGRPRTRDRFGVARPRRRAFAYRPQRGGVGRVGA